jgi:hypothetical protein
MDPKPARLMRQISADVTGPPHLVSYLEAAMPLEDGDRVSVVHSTACRQARIFLLYQSQVDGTHYLCSGSSCSVSVSVS